MTALNEAPNNAPIAAPRELAGALAREITKTREITKRPGENLS